MDKQRFCEYLLDNSGKDLEASEAIQVVAERCLALEDFTGARMLIKIMEYLRKHAEQQIRFVQLEMALGDVEEEAENDED